MIAYHNDSKIKENVLFQLNEHYAKDEIIRGRYWQNGKGCAVGCTIHSSDHQQYEHKFGIPRILSFLEDIIFEKLPNNLAKEWPIKFMSAITVGSDLSKVWAKFAIWLLSDSEYGVIKNCPSEHKSIINSIVRLYERSLIEEVSISYFKKCYREASNFEINHDFISSRTQRITQQCAFACVTEISRCSHNVTIGRISSLCHNSGMAYYWGYYDDKNDDSNEIKHYIAQSEKLINILKETI